MSESDSLDFGKTDITQIVCRNNPLAIGKSDVWSIRACRLVNYLILYNKKTKTIK